MKKPSALNPEYAMIVVGAFRQPAHVRDRWRQVQVRKTFLETDDLTKLRLGLELIASKGLSYDPSDPDGVDREMLRLAIAVCHPELDEVRDRVLARPIYKLVCATVGQAIRKGDAEFRVGLPLGSYALLTTGDRIPTKLYDAFVFELRFAATCRPQDYFRSGGSDLGLTHFEVKAVGDGLLCTWR